MNESKLLLILDAVKEINRKLDNLEIRINKIEKLLRP